MNRIFLAIIAAVGVPLILAGYCFLTEFLVVKLGGLKEKKARQIRPWFWILPEFILLSVFLLYPIINTIILSFKNADSTQFVGLENYLFVFTNPEMLASLGNNLLWLIFFTSIVVTLGLVLAVLTDRVPYEKVAKAIIFLPMGISCVAAGVIWKFMYQYSPPGEPQTGTLNAILSFVGSESFEPQTWIFDSNINNFCLIAVAIWMQTGFCMVILSAALKGIPQELLEVARIDGANEWQVFTKITIPSIKSTIIVVTTVMIVIVLKIFDIVYIMTNGNLNTEVIANRMYKEMFNFNNFGKASAIAVFLLLAIIPVMILNIKYFVQAKEK